MAKNSARQVEKDEKKIIKELRKNANKSVNDIAKNLGFSRQKVWRVIKNLEKNKTIWGYCAVVDNEKLGRKQYIMLIKRSNKPLGNTIDKIVDLTMHAKGKDIGVDVIKLGMLYDKEVIRAIYRAIQKIRKPIILDPVSVSTSGAKLLKEDAIKDLKEKAYPYIHSYYAECKRS